MAEYPNMTVLWAMRDFCLKRVDGRNGRGYIWDVGGGGVGDGKNSVMFLVWFVFFLKKIAQRLTFTVETLISLLLITISGFP